MAVLSLQAVTLLLLSQLARGFAIYESEKLDVTLGEGCIGSLSANINCLDYVQTFMMPSYRGSLHNVSFTDSICTGECSGSLKGWFDSVSKNCAGKSFNDAVPTKFGGYMWAGFNETCVKDPKTKQYCNDIIANFTLVDDISKMPKTELCHTCNVRRLVLMQSSQYSIYDSFYKTELEYVNTQCGLKTPTDIPPPLTVTQPEDAPYCVTGKRYTTKKGDTCNSIAKSVSVSAAALYMGNQAILPDCLDVDPDASLCIPPTCQTYDVSKSDTCSSIETALGLERGSVRTFNSWLTFDCANLQPATDYYGNTICVSPQGGTFTGTFPAPAPTATPELGDGYARTSIPPPVGVTVAAGTTLNCGKWHIVQSSETCSAICIQDGITSNLFRQVNPSLKASSCDAALKVGTALCVGPTYSWKMTLPATTSTAPSTASLTQTVTSKSTSTTKVARRAYHKHEHHHRH